MPNRKEAKDHGEGGNLVGSPLKAASCWSMKRDHREGTAIRESMDLIHANGAEPAS